MKQIEESYLDMVRRDLVLAVDDIGAAVIPADWSAEAEALGCQVWRPLEMLHYLEMDERERKITRGVKGIK